MTDQPNGAEWLAQAQEDIRRDASTLPRAFALVGRKFGRGPVQPASDPRALVHGRIEDIARASLIVLLLESEPSRSAAVLGELFQRGDSAERRGVLRGFDALEQGGMELPDDVIGLGVSLVNEALRTNEADVVAAAVGPFAAANLDQHSWRHAVLKLVFMEVTLDAVAGLDRRTDRELARMAQDFAAERRAAGRPVPLDIDRLTPKGAHDAHL